MPIFRRKRLCITAYGVLHWLCLLWLCGAGLRAVCTLKVIVRTVTFTAHTARSPTSHNHSKHKQCRTPYAVIHNLVLLKMGIMMPETCCDRSLIINTRLVASCWFLSLHPMGPYVFTMSYLFHTHCNFIFQYMLMGFQSKAFFTQYLGPRSAHGQRKYLGMHLNADGHAHVAGSSCGRPKKYLTKN